MPITLPNVPSIAVFLWSAFLALGYAAPATADTPVTGDYFHTGAGARYLDRTTDKTILVPGHGAVGHRAQLIEFRDMLVTARDKVAALKLQGKSLDDIIAAKPTAAFDDKWGRFVIGSTFFTKLVYEGL